MQTIQHSFSLSNQLADTVYAYYHQKQTPAAAIYRYGGVLYKALDAQSIKINPTQIYILSAFYGLVRPFDDIIKYRLDFTHSRLGNLYQYWKKPIRDYLTTKHPDEVFVDLTSKEFESLLPKTLKIYRIDFIYKNQKKLSTVLLKQLRGYMARYLVSMKVDSIEAIKTIEVQGFHYDTKLSKEKQIIFSL